MNTRKLLTGAALVTLSAGLAAPQAEAATAAGTISAVVVAPITMTSTTALKFGSFSVTGTGSFAISTTGTESGRVGSTDIGAAYQAGGFSITADTRAMTVSIDTVATIKNTGSTASMNITGINFDCNSANWTGTVQTGAASGVCNLAASPGIVKTGGTINYSAAQAPGTYTGSYTLTASYN